MAKTHIVLIHGAYHQGWHFHLLRQKLEDASHVVSAPQLPSAGTNPVNDSLAEDTAVAKAAIEAAAQDADKVIPVFHSYCGIPGSEAVAGLTPAARAKIVRLVYLAAFVIEQGTSLTTPSRGKPSPWAVREADGATVSVPDPLTVFYHDVEPPS